MNDHNALSRRAALVGLTLLAACSRPSDPGAAPSAAPSAKVSRSVTIKGSDTMVILGQRWAEAYGASHPGASVQITGGGSGTGIAALTNGATDVCQSSRPMKPEEKAKVKAARNADAIETPVALDALAVYVHASNPIASLTLAQLAKIYVGETKKWSDLGGSDAPIILYGRENNSGTYGYFKEHVLANKDFASAVQTLAGTAAVASAVGSDKAGIGYGGIAYLAGVRAVPVRKDDASTPVAPSRETALDGSYPLARSLFFYTAGAPVGEAASFVAWVKGPEGQKVIDDVGYFPVPKR